MITGKDLEHGLVSLWSQLMGSPEEPSRGWSERLLFLLRSLYAAVQWRPEVVEQVAHVDGLQEWVGGGTCSPVPTLPPGKPVPCVCVCERQGPGARGTLSGDTHRLQPLSVVSSWALSLHV